MGELRYQDLDLAPEATGRALHNQVVELYPLFRSITGEGLRETLRWVAGRIPLEIHEVPTGTTVLDWTIPREWSVREAYIKGPAGERVVDFRDLNLHLMSYSVPVTASMSLAELQEHLHSQPDNPDVVPYRSSFYTESWGFCLTHRQRMSLEEGTYEVRIDSTLTDGALSYGECVLPGETAEEVLISTHVCHPSLANDNLSGIVVATKLAQLLSNLPHRYTYRFVFVPATIGAITWLARNEETIGRIKHGLVLASVGDAGPLTYKRSRRSDTEIDQAFEHVLDTSGDSHDIVDFEPFGYDERQYCSPGFDIPAGSLSRTRFGSYAEYHTSGDNPDFVLPSSLFDTVSKCLAVLQVLEDNGYYLNLRPKGEPQLGKHGLLESNFAKSNGQRAQRALQWVLSGSDGLGSLLDIAHRSGLPFSTIRDAAQLLEDSGLLARLQDPSSR
jgi:aminopeptidase-like protein